MRACRRLGIGVTLRNKGAGREVEDGGLDGIIARKCPHEDQQTSRNMQLEG
jgi:hypothetical protein